MNGVANTDGFVWRLVKTVAEIGVVDEDSAKLKFRAASVDAVAKVVISSFDRTETVQVVNEMFSFAGLWTSMDEVGFGLLSAPSAKWLQAFENDLEIKGASHPMIAEKHLLLGSQPSLKNFGAEVEKKAGLKGSAGKKTSSS